MSSICLCDCGCFPDAKEIGELIPGCFLIERSGKYFLLTQPGHSGDVLLCFPCKPYPDPDPDMKPDQELGPDGVIAAKKWIDIVIDWGESIKLPPLDGWFLMDACYKAGMKQRGCWDIWLFDRAGKMVEGKPLT